MQQDKDIFITNKWKKLLRDMIVFSCFYILMLWVVEPRLLYNSFGVDIRYPAFRWGWDFLSGFLSYPGGAIEYTGAFLSQWYFYSWLGAAIVMIIAWGVCKGFGHYLSLAGTGTHEFISYIPAAAMLAMQLRYSHPLNLSLALLAALWFSVLYIALTTKGRPTNAGIFILIFVALYHLSGGAVLLFSILVILHEMLNRRNYMMAVIVPVFSVLFVWLYSVHILDMSWTNVAPGMSREQPFSLLAKLKWQIAASLPLTPIQPKTDLITKYIVQGLYLFIVITSFLVCLKRILPQRVKAAKKRKRTNRKKRATELPNAKTINPFIRWIGATTILVLFMLICGHMAFDRSIKKQHKIDYLSSRKKWREVLKEVNDLTREEYNFHVNHDINLSLFFTGNLADRMFKYPQRKESLLLLFKKEKVNSKIFFKRSKLFLDMGLIGKAEKTAYEILEMTGDHPEALKLLAKVNLAKGDIETAKVFLNALSQNIVEGRYARKTLKLVEQDPDMSSDPEIRKLREVAVKTDDTDLTFNTEKAFNDLLASNPNNKLAFEYMMAYYLLTRQVDKIAGNINRLDDFGYEKLPRYYDEAMAIYINRIGTDANVPAKWMPGKHALETADTFSEVNERAGSNRKAAMQQLAKAYGDSYFYYYLYGASGVSL